MLEKTAIIFIDIQASGKSTFYHERFEEYVHINWDTLHTRNKENILLQECVESGALLWWIIQIQRGWTERRELFVDYDIPLGQDYREFVLQFLDED